MDIPEEREICRMWSELFDLSGAPKSGIAEQVQKRLSGLDFTLLPADLDEAVKCFRGKHGSSKLRVPRAHISGVLRDLIISYSPELSAQVRLLHERSVRFHGSGGPVLYEQMLALTSYPSLVHCFSTRAAGNMSFTLGDRESVTRNRQALFHHLGIEEERVCVMDARDHGSEIHLVTEGDLGSNVRADCLVTTLENSYLFLAVADCLPIIIHDPQRKVLALVHAGWRGTQERICEKAITFLVERLGAVRDSIAVAIGPSIKSKSYWFDLDECSQRESPDWQPFLYRFDNAPGRIHVDLLGYNKAQLASQGIASDRVLVHHADTFEGTFFSHRRSALDATTAGRFAILVGIAR